MSEVSPPEAMEVSPELVAAIPSEGSSSSAAGNPEEIRTIFVLGFPTDVKEQEFWNILKWWPGYEACMMDFKGEQPLGFARFKTAAQARAARDLIQNVVLDRDGAKSRMSLRAEMARKNLYLKPANGRHSGSWNRSGNDGFTALSTSQLPQLFQPHHLGHSGRNPPNPLATFLGQHVMLPDGYVPLVPPWFFQSMQWNGQPLSVPGNGFAHQYSMPNPVAFGYASGVQLPAQHTALLNRSASAVLGSCPSSYLPAMICTPMHNSKDHPPCNTLFIGNLGMGTNEWEIRSFFGSFPGFRQLKILRSVHGTTCFVEFQDVASAAYVHQSMQGAVLSSSNRGGMRIQFSKNPFGCRGDGSRSSPSGFQFDRDGETEKGTGCESVVSLGSDWSNNEADKDVDTSLANSEGEKASDNGEMPNGEMPEKPSDRTSEGWQNTMDTGEQYYSPDGHSDVCNEGSPRC
eukprot:TRINITY_DN9848_c0_g1_i3.p1 TRINITY_DN9848_c0_g1~~TRINITY_DN9848_c0_g1_i3.p1  ORF type:complete len:459 (+),score=72.18 TRINITY_DN9848_c0_g1_i3:264-1640(+)